MKQNSMTTPIYIIEEKKLRKNLALIADVAKKADVEIILAFKAFALWKTFPIFREYINSTTASSLSEARLAKEEFGAKAHTFSPAYTDNEIDEIVNCSSHLTFNSLSQYERYHDRVAGKVSIGLRVNPEYSEVGTMLYNPCAPGTRFGVTADKLPETLPADVEGFHCHCHCESGADVLERTLVHIEEKFSKWFPQLKWLNLGGGHLMTRKDYDVPLLINILKGLHERYPWLKIILEPGSAFAWQTGPLVSHVVDVVEDKGIRTAILDVSFTCHMPDCLEMPYYPDVRGAEHVDMDGDVCVDPQTPFLYRLGGNSCLSGDFMASWKFDHELKVGEEVIFEDMIHYTTVKTCMFNGISHPALGMLHEDGNVEILKTFGYEDYRNRMD
ncbi:carboxynorspermidine decarboxylase [Prevotella sp. E15-22]|uniref:carboxynorspermidine decarboxylase n=1 Tax=Prevotella sp. E15-22 TaxID=2937774 RepID=UPI00205788C3|nr:carboxynorspermidine decarboxylase [Prevotella sp. E15-22]UPS45480.1 carboxynorspermidine decarboxylase [Prevotella sp. E15-22]